MKTIESTKSGISKKPALVLVVLLSVLASCTSTTVDEFRQGETGIENDESVVILGRRQASDYETRAEFVDCVGDRMTQGANAISIIPEQEFVDAMFPWFEPRTAPLRTQDLEKLMAEQVVADKMDEFGVRYIVWLDGFTETTDRSGSISCTVGPGGAGCFGFGSWEDDANFDARVWDVGTFSNVGTISTDATGQSYVPALIIPIPLIARVEANACSRLADQLKGFVNGG
ncbi:MAG: hypothetical protein HOF74_13760 [Gammaproteobacteria bacterium]|jgi:hypothetical protein|nr:hypothetical protein [Gammaproteobacteria bacterium]MBT3860893.1 hypothetical protein [Gammaproteobacteria bacterium]MBT3988416.1 hypothetical protein [Gammaproteobacteria bacterium]MBT4581475.1 hypothetical protein [Gammaproteobacteria bacterium]MBT4657356.1 hypothetical protein [Gammaproteobacteria bacterium]